MREKRVKERERKEKEKAKKGEYNGSQEGCREIEDLE